MCVHFLCRHFVRYSMYTFIKRINEKKTPRERVSANEWRNIGRRAQPHVFGYVLGIAYVSILCATHRQLNSSAAHSLFDKYITSAIEQSAIILIKYRVRIVPRCRQHIHTFRNKCKPTIYPYSYGAFTFSTLQTGMAARDGFFSSFHSLLFSILPIWSTCCDASTTYSKNCINKERTIWEKKKKKQ